MNKKTELKCPKCKNQMVFVSYGKVGKIFQCFTCDKIEVVKQAGSNRQYSLKE